MKIMRTSADKFMHSPFADQLEVVATIKDRIIAARISELREEDAMTAALRSMLDSGVSLDELSNASGLAPTEIQRRIGADRVMIG